MNEMEKEGQIKGYLQFITTWVLFLFLVFTIILISDTLY